VPFPTLVPRDRVFFDLFNQAGQNTLRAAELLHQMIGNWPEEAGLAREILLVEQEGDRITHDLANRVNSTFVTPIDGEDIYSLAGQIDDIVDYIEETADFMGLYRIEAPMEQSLALAEVLVKSCEQLAAALAHLREFKNISKHTVEVHRLENDGDRIVRGAIASLFEEGIDPMVVIRWKDIFELIEDAIDATERVAFLLEGIVIKNA
jgi:predicted phosphate transport protein (TIGR00153 family)